MKTHNSIVFARQEKSTKKVNIDISPLTNEVQLVRLGVLLIKFNVRQTVGAPFRWIFR